MHRTLPTLALALLATTASAQTIITEDFETYATGEFPAPDWLDAAEIPDPPIAPIPSCTVEITTGADGLPTQALANIEEMTASQGVYRFVPVSERYIVAARVRIDQIHDFAENETGDWTWGVGVGQFQPGVDLGAVPQVGIYGSCFTGGWRLYALGTAGAYADIDLDLPIDLGRWYLVEMDLDAARGIVRSRLSDASTGQCLRDRTDVIEGWTPADAGFDILTFFEWDAGSGQSTRANVCVLDEIRATLFGSPCPADFNRDGEVNSLDVLAFLNAWTGGCP